MSLVHRYGQACVEQRWSRAGVLYGQIVRCLDEQNIRAVEVDAPVSVDRSTPSV